MNHHWLPLPCAILAILLVNSCSATAAPAESYLSELQGALGGSNLAGLTASAERAAGEFLGGGKLWAAGRQADFIAEACGRAGGLLAIAPLGEQSPGTHDIILYAAPGLANAEDRNLIERWRQQGVLVVEFDSGAGLYRERYPLDTVVNVVDLWTWTGEFVAACTRRGKMPVLYQSYGLPGGRERAKKYQGKRIHDDLTIGPLPAGLLGRQYVDRLEAMLVQIGNTQRTDLTQAAAWWARATSPEVLFTGHMFPRHAQDPRSPTAARFAAAAAWEDKELLDPAHPPQFVLYIGYQFPPRKLLEQAQAMRVKLVYSSVQAAQPPEPAGNILYLAPAWPLTDGCVAVPGYDVPILPASGVIQAAIYWTIASSAGSAPR